MQVVCAGIMETMIPVVEVKTKRIFRGRRAAD
jgi:hypothetical protein